MSEESRAWSSLEPVIRTTLAAEVKRELAKRSRYGAFVYFLVAVVLALTTSYFREHPAVLATVGSLSFLLGASRIMAASVLLKQLPDTGRLTCLTFYGSTYATMVVWGLFCGWTLRLYPQEWTAMFLLLNSAALAAGVSSSLAPSIGLASRALVLLVVPTIISAATLGGRRDWAVAGVASVYLVFLLAQAKNTWRILWNANVNAERERLRGTAERRQAVEERAKLVAAIEQAAEEILITDIDGNIQYCNPFFEKASGYSRSEAIGRNPRFLKSGKQDAELYRALWNTIKEGGVWTGRFVNRKKDGSLYELDGTISPIYDAFGKITGFVSARHDVTERLQLESQLRQAQKMESIGRLAGGIAHDFNNILTVILSQSSALEEDLAGEFRRQERAAQIREASERAADLTRQLLTFSRKQPIQPKPLDLNKHILGVRKLLQHLAGEDIALELSLAPKLGLVRADAGQIDQVLMNLVANARDAMPHGGKVRIGTADVNPVDATDPAILLAVADTGKGMDEETKRHIFEPFFTTKDPGRGTGLGLATVYGIVQQSRGRIEVQSDPIQGGTTFSIYLPRITGDRFPEAGLDRGVAPVQGLRTLLVVEDEPDVRSALVEMLESCGFRVLSAECGRTALRVAEEHAGPIDMLVTDALMPEMTGKQVADALASRYPDMKLLYMSGYSGDILTQLGTLDSDSAYLVKPFSVATLAAKVRELLDSDGGQKHGAE